MNRPFAILSAVALVGWTPIAAARDVAAVSGWGSAAVSSSVKAVWLNGPDEQAPLALALVLYRGPDGWHNLEWKSSLEISESSGEIVLSSQRLELSLLVHPEQDRVEIQGQEFALSRSNVFVVEKFLRRRGRDDVWPQGRFDNPDPQTLPLGLGITEGVPSVVRSLRENPGSRGSWFSKLPKLDLIYGGFAGGVQKLTGYVGGQAMGRRWSGPLGAVEFGLGGGKLTAGWFWIRPKDSALKYSTRLAVLRTWGDPSQVQKGQTLIGTEASASIFVYTGRVGVFRGRSRDEGPEEWILSLSFGVGL